MLAAGRSTWSAAGAGVVLALGIFLSYGLVLIGILALAIVVLSRRWSLLPWTVAGAAVVVVAFTASGFWWLDGYFLVKERYYAGLGGDRPYAYWVWANLAALALCAGPASAAIVHRAARALTGHRAAAARPDAAQAPGTALRGRTAGLRGATASSITAADRRVVIAARARWAAAAVIRHPAAPARVVLPLAALTAILIADLSGLSKAETERIWLPFAVWLPAGTALLATGDRRGWLAVQAGTALLVNHLLLTSW
jgi:hypothetical protein